MQSGMHLVGYHLPLDAHETVATTQNSLAYSVLRLKAVMVSMDSYMLERSFRERCWQPILPNELMQRLVEPRFLLAMRKNCQAHRMVLWRCPR